jgi:hypothetical protein
MDAFDKLTKYLLSAPRPLIGAETIQLILMREILDFTVLRTEESRELNSANTPLSETERDTVVKRVAFMGSKQKAAVLPERQSMPQVPALRTVRRQRAQQRS